MAEISYYWTEYTTGWDNDPSYMFDGILTNYAYTVSDGDQVHPMANTCDGTYLGTISKVEIRFYGHGDGNDEIETRVFNATSTLYAAVMPSSPGWSAYVDVTNDPLAPSPWTFPDIQNLDPYRVWYNKQGKANTMYCAKVEMRVTYTVVAVLPTIVTRPVGNERKTTAIGYGQITLSTPASSKRGVCWNTTGNPDVNDSKSEETGSFGVGYFSRPITGLTAGQHYYLKAYAYNSEGYGYGSQVEFDALPTDSEVLLPNAAGDENAIDNQYPADSFPPADHWNKVGEDTPDDGDTYVGTVSVTYPRDLYHLPAHSGSGTINRVVVHFRCRSQNNSNGRFKASIKSDSTVTDGAQKLPSVVDLWENFSQEWVNNPAGSHQAWEWPDIDDFQIGVSLYGEDISPSSAECTQVYVVVYYTPSGPPSESGMEAQVI